MYRELNPQLICRTAQALDRRIGERFPDSGLRRVSAELLAVASETEARIERLRRPQWPLRALLWSGATVMLGATVVVPMLVRVRTEVTDISDLMQGIEAAVNNVIFVAIALWFLLTAEQRPKRKAVLMALHELRSLAHIVDMHQLTKDPERLLSPEMNTASSPERSLSRFELARYLDYCTEMLSIVSKLAALYAQYFFDPRVLDAVNDVETLSDGLSTNIWQKIQILDNIALRRGELASPAAQGSTS